MTKNLITINQFIKRSLGEWKSLRSTHSLAFQEVENTSSKIKISELEITNKKVDQLLKEFYSFIKDSYIPISINWYSISDWEEDKDKEVANEKTVLVFIPKNYNSGIVLRNKGYTEQIISSSEYLLDEKENLHIKTIYNSTISEERICFLSNHVRCRFSIIRNKDNNAAIQTSHSSEIRNVTTLKD